MAKVEYGRLTVDERVKLRAIVDAVLRRVGVPPRAVGFVQGWITDSELVMLARRFQIAQRLVSGHSFQRIEADMRAGFATIQQVHDWLETRLEGYRGVLPPLLGEGARRHGLMTLDPLSLRALCRRYRWDIAVMHAVLGRP